MNLRYRISLIILGLIEMKKESAEEVLRMEKIKGTKCEKCFDGAWCWCALKESCRKICLGPFLSFEDFQEKFRESNEGVK